MSESMMAKECTWDPMGEPMLMWYRLRDSGKDQMLCFYRSLLILYIVYHSLNGSSDSVNGDLQFLWG